ncbi:hypothetical protein [Klebsiella sp. 1SOBk2mer]|uniref:hypothetical protein n=1 Tax=Klebsiella sp. 1SOBk2mer TaxID=3391012 RepID=UPI00398360DE
MQEFKGTPGPWCVNTIGKHWNNLALVHLEVTFGTDGECICDTVYRREDADLIAAAPELLEALLGYMSAVERMNQAMKDGVNVQGAISVLVGYEDMAHSAINKALGK